MSPNPVRPKVLGLISEAASPWVAAVLALIAGGALTTLLVSSNNDRHHRQVLQRFNLLASERVSRIQERFDDQIQRLDGLRRFFVYSEDVTRKEFDGFAGPLLMWTQAYSWAPRVSAAERPGFEQRARDSGLSDFAIRERDVNGELVPAAQRAEYFPVLFSQSRTTLPIPLGFDVGSDDTRRATLGRARVLVGAAVSPRMNLVGLEPANSSGVLLVTPVMAGSAAKQTLAGYVVAVISLRKLLSEGLPAQTRDNLTLQLYDLWLSDQPDVLYQSSNGVVDSDLKMTTLLSMADRDYRLDIRPSAAFMADNQSSSTSVAVLGALLSVLLSALFFILGSQRQRALSLVEQRTSELSRVLVAWEKLSAQVPGGIYQFQQNADGSARFNYTNKGMLQIYELPPNDLHNDASAVFGRIHPQDIERIMQSISLSSEHLTPWCEEYRVELPKQGLRWLRGEAKPERLPEGGVLWHGFVSDITDLKRVEDELRALSVTDVLTGVYNRRYFQERLKAELSRVHRHGGALSVIMLDVDHFKRINDQFGHAMGDHVLQGLCQRIGLRLRRDDVFCRLGGEEFMVLCPDTTREHAHALATDLWQVLRSEPIDGVGTVTASFGIASWRSAEGGDALLLRADSGVYAAKQAGRDRVEPELP
ncbi:diguanylate cyclase [Pseudomonas sp. NA-150]|uniref:sensor domain-containing diguanylate cyclase n=1 Tax=Pseudomonas sp. NA-150 TaxID=3367525 RepID=UPI0037CA6E5A